MFRAPERSACSSAEAREDSSVRRPCSSWSGRCPAAHWREQLGDAIGHGDDSRCYLIGNGGHHGVILQLADLLF